MSIGAVLKEFYIKLGLDADAASFASGTALVNLLEKGLDGLVDIVKDAAKAIPEWVKEVSEMGDHIDEAAQKAGVGRDELQELAYAGQFSSLSMEDVTEGLGHLVRKMGEASAGSKETAAAFTKALGKGSLEDANGHLRNAADVLGDLADRFAAMPDGADKTKMAFDVLGKSGARFIPMLNQGREGLAKLRAEFKASGAEMDDELIDASAAYRDSIDRLKTFGQAFKIQTVGVIIKVLPAFIKALQELVKIVMPVGKVIGILLSRAFLILVDAKHAVEGLIHAFQWLWRMTSDFGRAAIVAAAGFLTAWVLASAPILVLVALASFLYLLWDDILTGLRGGKSVIFDLYDQWSDFLEAWMQPQDSDPWWLTLVKNFLYTLTHLQEVWDFVEQSLENAFDKAATYVKSVFQDIIDWINARIAEVMSVVDTVKSVIGDIKESVTGSGIENLVKRIQADASTVKGPVPSYTAPSAVVSGGKSTSVATNINTLTINANGDAKPTDIASSLRKAIDEQNQKMLRDAQAGVR